ncbi:LysR family transcriptional regulator [Variovorax saccharolyticus]|uniref:LysR family transcriptional regulator n=1 Tax=Variovorax saccharolyticus TaxID=3053516 RepID=UPI0025790C0C|nr:LysR family transcriptional regulator [Variovorax sp. J22R187]MDM0021059.1 LysR family transcriptional regulator [Variovorax sp. J22R187]
MTFKQLEALYWIGQLGSFALAANKLHTSQSAVSKRVHELEMVFDTELFDRTQRSARLTDKGEEMFMLAKALLEQRDAAIEQFSRVDVIERRVRIGITELTAMTWFPRWVELISDHYPKVSLEPDVDSSVNLREKVLADELDLIVVPDAFADTRIPSKAVGQVESAWMCKPGFMPADGPVRLHELAAQRLLIQGSKSGTGLLYDSWMKELGIQPANAIVVHNLVALIGLTLSGLGVSYLPKRAVSQMIDAGTLIALDVAPALPSVTYVAMYKGEHRSALLASIIMLAQECCDFDRMFQASREPGGDRR